MSALKVEFHHGGVYLPRLGLWLDPHFPQQGDDIVFISHAHSDHTELHREVILSDPTSRLMHSRIPGQWIEHVAPFGSTLKFPGKPIPFEIKLLPAGHIFGSTMALVRAEGETLLYTGDFKLRPSLSAETCQPEHADILIMETTYGRAHYQFPPTAEVIKGVIRFCREALDNEETPVLLGYSLGKSQEILCGLAEAGLPIMLHGTVHRLTQIYEQFGKCFPPYEQYDAATARGKVLLCPPNVANSSMLRNLGRTRAAILTGWAVDPNCRFRYGAHAAFPLSDHADFPELLEFVQRVKPKHVLTLHGFAAEFAQTLRERGFDAHALSQEDQLALPLLIPPTPQSVVAAPAIPPRDSTKSASSTPPELAFSSFASTCARIASTTKKLEKTKYLAEYFKQLKDKPLGLVAVWFTGAPFPSTQNKVLQLGWAIIRDTLTTVGKITEQGFGQVYLKHSDLGEAAQEILTKSNPTEGSETLESIDNLFQNLLTARGPLAKLPILVDTLSRCTPLEAKYLVKILTGDLRIGLKEGLVEEAIAQAFAIEIDKIKGANLLLGNIGETAVLAQHNQLPSVTLIPFRPVKYMLASPEETAMDIWKRVREWNLPHKGATPSFNSVIDPVLTVWLEDKYDGIRAQIHKVGATVAIFSRDLKEITKTFYELADAVRDLPSDFILDGEIVAMRGDQVLPYADLQRRLGRREGDLFLGEQIPVQFVAFDLLWQDNKSYLDESLSIRRAQLEALPTGKFRLAQITQARSAEEIEEAFTAARSRNNEGLIIKDPQSTYSPGRRGLSWLKLKKAYATLDCVVVGAEYGHGKRKAVLSDYTFAIRDDATGELKTIGKAYTGLTDHEIAQLTQQFLKKVIWTKGRYHAVQPDVVLEIAFDLLQPSARHTSGLAMRFPRIVRIRTDKTAVEADTLTTARRIAGVIK